MAVALTLGIAVPVKQQLAAALPRLISAYDPERIYLYGSQARGDATVDSDIDVLVVMPDGFLPTYEDYAHSSEVVGFAAPNVNVLFATVGAYARQLPLLASLPATVAREGCLLYERT